MYLVLKFWRQTGRPSCQPVWKATIDKFEVITYPIDSQKNNPKIAIKNSWSNHAESCRAKNCNVCQVYGVDLDLWVFVCYWELTKVSKDFKFANFHSNYIFFLSWEFVFNPLCKIKKQTTLNFFSFQNFLKFSNFH